MVYLNGGIILHLVHGNNRLLEIRKDILIACVKSLISLDNLFGCTNLIKSNVILVMQWWMLNGNDLNNHAKISEIRFDTYVASYMSCQDDLLNLDNFYPLQIKQKIWKSIIKISFATAQISSRFYFIPFSQKSKQHKKLKYTKDDTKHLV